MSLGRMPRCHAMDLLRPLGLDIYPLVSVSLCPRSANTLPSATRLFRYMSIVRLHFGNIAALNPSLFRVRAV